MEFYEYLKCICNRNSGAVGKDDKRRYSFLVRRLFAAQFPIQCELINRLDSDPLVDAEVVNLLAMRYKGVPQFLKEKVDQTKKKETIRKFYEDDVLNKYMEINGCGIREIEEAFEFDRDSLDFALKLIKSNFFNDKDKVIIRKTEVKPKKEKSLF